MQDLAGHEQLGVHSTWPTLSPLGKSAAQNWVVCDDLFFARVVLTGEGRLREAPLLYSSRLGWRAAGESAREPGQSVRDRLLERLEALGLPAGDQRDNEE